MNSGHSSFITDHRISLLEEAAGGRYPVSRLQSRFPFPVCYTPLLDPAASSSSGTLRSSPVSRSRLRVLLITNVIYPVLQGAGDAGEAQDLSFPFSFALITGHLLVFICIGVRELVQRDIFFKLLTFVEAYLIYHGIINKGEKHMKYLVMVSDLVARQVYVDASSKEEALENANYGKWRLPEDVEHEEVVDRQAVEILEEEGSK
jgi:hypothetical protein